MSWKAVSSVLTHERKRKNPNPSPDTRLHSLKLWSRLSTHTSKDRIGKRPPSPPYVFDAQLPRREMNTSVKRTKIRVEGWFFFPFFFFLTLMYNKLQQSRDSPPPNCSQIHTSEMVLNAGEFDCSLRVTQNKQLHRLGWRGRAETWRKLRLQQ